MRDFKNIKVAVAGEAECKLWATKFHDKLDRSLE